MRRTILVIVLIIASTFSNPIVIRTGLNKDHSQKQDSNVFDSGSVKGIANYEGDEGFNLNNEQQHAKAQDAGSYGERNSQNKQHTNANQFGDEQYRQQNADDLSNFNKKQSHKKGHHKSGFTKSYHKDEREDNTSYYDDANDEGDGYVQTNKKNSYGDVAQQQRHGQDYDNHNYAQDQTKNGYYDKAGSYQKDLANRRDYKAKNYYDGHENLGRRNNANQYGVNDQYNQEKYINKPHYYDYDDPYYYNYRPRKTITVYEDPRYDGVGGGYERYPRYDNDYVQLDYRQSSRDNPDYRYYNKRPTYDDYYYY